MPKLPPLPFFVLRGHEGNVSALHFVTETDDTIHCQTLISGSDSGEIFLWNLMNFRTYHRFTSHGRNMIIFLHYYKSMLLSQGREGVVDLWCLMNGQWVIKAKIPSQNVGFCSSILLPTPETAFIFLFDEDKNSITLYDFEKKSKSKELGIKSSTGMCMCIKAFYMNGKMLLLTGYEDGCLGLWDCDSETEVSQIKCHKETVICLDFDERQRYKGISGSVDEFLETWTVSEELQLCKDSTVTIRNPGVNTVHIREDCKIVVTAGHDSKIRVFSWKSLKPLAVLDFHKLAVLSLDFCSVAVSDKQSVFASGSKDKNIGLWSIY